MIINNCLNAYLLGQANDPHISSVKLLMGFEGVDGATASSDESPAAHGGASFQGNAQLDTAQFKFGASSLLLDGVNDSINYADSADWDFGSGQFTVEAWVRFNGVGTDQCVMGQWRASGSLQSWMLYFHGASSVLGFAYSTTGANSTAVQASWSPSTGTWYHIAADRDSGGTLRVYAHGTMITSAAANVTFFNPAITMKIGVRDDDSRDFNGWIDELRITKGVARYASDSGYTVPTAAFPRS